MSQRLRLWSHRRRARLRTLPERVGARVRRARGGVAGRGSTVDYERMFFLVGSGKSGTSWLMQTLDAHSEVLCRGEGVFFGRQERMDESGAVSLYDAMLESEQLRAWTRRSAWTREDRVDTRLADLVGTIVGRLMGEQLERSGKRIVGDKSLLLGPEVIRELAAACPGARVIHIVRDGRDVAVSSTHHIWNNSSDEGGGRSLGTRRLAIRDAYRADPEGFRRAGRSIFGPRELERTAARWGERVSSAREQGRALLGERYTEVRYEDLLDSGAPELSRLFEFLGVDASVATSERCLRGTDFARQSGGRRPGVEDSRAFHRKGVAGDWEGQFTAEDRETFKRVAGRRLIEFGYETGADW